MGGHAAWVHCFPDQLTNARSVTAILPFSAPASHFDRNFMVDIKPTHLVFLNPDRIGPIDPFGKAAHP